MKKSNENFIMLPTIIQGNYPDEKTGILDVRDCLSDGTQFDLEMQVAYFEYWDKRTMFYWSKMFTHPGIP